jgi:predicted CopG family antitoxin
MPTIHVSKQLYAILKKRKTHKGQSFDDVIFDLVEDTLELSEETKKKLRQSERDIKAGRFYTLAQTKNELFNQ